MRNNLLRAGLLAVVLATPGCGPTQFYNVNEPTYKQTYWSPKSVFKNEPGKSAPDFTFQDDKTGKIGKLSDYLGKVVVIFFFNADDNCVPSMGPFSDLSNLHRNRKVEVIGIHEPRMQCSAVSRLEDYKKRFSPQFPIHTDNGRISKFFYNGEIIPATVIVGSDGKIVSQRMGFPKDLSRFLKK